MRFLDLVALGTVADVVPLKGLNRAFVTKGLIALRRRRNPGLTAPDGRRAACRSAARRGISASCSDRASMRAAASAAPTLGVELLMEDDPAAGRSHCRVNSIGSTASGRRIELATLAQAEAEAMAALGSSEQGAVMVTAGEGWHPGVVGLDGGAAEGAIRPAGFRHRARARRHRHRLGPLDRRRRYRPGGAPRRRRRAAHQGRRPRHGGRRDGAQGRARAPSAHISRTALAAAVQAARRDDALLIDGAVTAAGANSDMLAMIARAGPFGAGNPEPVIVLPAHTLVYAEDAGQSHMRVRLRASDGASIGAIAFRARGQPLGAALAAGRGQRLHAAGTLCMDHWNGIDRMQLRLVDMAPADDSLGLH